MHCFVATAEKARYCIKLKNEKHNYLIPSSITIKQILEKYNRKALF